MNVLILTPDAVGSTLLQRLITIYMQFHNFNKPVINLHELTNGLIKYHSSVFDQEVLGKDDSNWGYHQSLQEVIGLLDGADHYKTSRLAQYHIRARRDTIEQQIPFYRYLNQNFYIIACRRHNVFEHAVSWALTKITKKLNVYTPEEKIKSFFHLYRDQVTLDPESLLQTLETYKVYLQWCEDHFSVASYFYYDQHLPNIERYILDLPIFAGQPKKISWQESYGIEFNDWNRCHFLSSDVGSLALDHPKEFAQISSSTSHNLIDQLTEENFITSYNDVADSSWPRINSVAEFNTLPVNIQKECNTVHKLVQPYKQQISTSHNVNLVLPPDHAEFLSKHAHTYNVANQSLSSMTAQLIMISAPPIKKQTMSEKQFMIKNFNQCLDVYNEWISNNPTVGNPVGIDTLEKLAQLEKNYWSQKTQQEYIDI